MKTIAFDIMGNDNGVQPGVEAVVSFVKKNPGYKFILVGNKKEILKYTNSSEQIEIRHTTKVVDKKAKARAARDGDTSMAVAVDLVKQGKADAVISSGDSGIYLSIATLTLRRLDGIKRPAFMPIFPTIINDKRFVMLDTGANLEVDGEMLEQWAVAGSVFSNKVLKVKKPKVGIVNIGTEDNKGKDFHAEAHQLLKKNKKVNYIGFIEPRELLNGVVDVAVADGYGGNLILKTMEGTVLSLMKVIKKSLLSRVKYKLGALLAKGAFKQVGEQLDYRNVGAAWVIGLNGLAIKAHGGSDTKSFIGAFSQIKIALDNNAQQEFAKAIKGKND